MVWHFLPMSSPRGARCKAGIPVSTGDRVAESEDAPTPEALMDELSVASALEAAEALWRRV